MPDYAEKAEASPSSPVNPANTQERLGEQQILQSYHPRDRGLGGFRVEDLGFLVEGARISSKS